MFSEIVFHGRRKKKEFTEGEETCRKQKSRKSTLWRRKELLQHADTENPFRTFARSHSAEMERNERKILSCHENFFLLLFIESICYGKAKQFFNDIKRGKNYANFRFAFNLINLISFIYSRASREREFIVKRYEVPVSCLSAFVITLLSKKSEPERKLMSKREQTRKCSSGRATITKCDTQCERHFISAECDINDKTALNSLEKRKNSQISKFSHVMQ